MIWQRIRFTITTYDAGGRITVKDFEPVWTGGAMH
ncbi:hypothetical protein D0T12_04555 [Actinomadura spongiicola]|uniref:Uncharacterized protein n=1 Tax=Actinomadura spongiicola TaxID=2303421 RepID=A0A372GR63_9ACTN|nr:hypothetical protein D0T12_04555 [Actinomadura spongiicola]